MYPVDWDFRRFSKDEAKHGTRYERCRDQEWLRKEVADWLSRTLLDLFPLHGRDKAKEFLGQWANKTIKELVRARIRSLLPAHVENALFNSIPRRVGLALGTLAFWFPEFPKPFLEIPESDRRKRIRAMEEENQSRREQSPHAKKPVHFESPEEIAAAFKCPTNEIILRNREAASRIIHVRLDLGFGLPAVREALTTLVRRSYPHLLRNKSPRGRAVADDTPFVPLRRLSAERLDREGLAYEQARIRCKEKQEAIPTPDACQVLPLYGNAHSWRTAVAKSKASAREFFGDLEHRDPSPELEPPPPESFRTRFLNGTIKWKKRPRKSAKKRRLKSPIARRA